MEHEVLRRGREVGGPALRSKTFHERADLLSDLAVRVRSARADLLAACAEDGVAPADAAHDVDAGIAEVRGLANRAKRELPDDVVLVAAETTPLNRGGSLVAQRLSTSPTGVVVHVTALGLPVWSTLRGVGAALLAGAASVVKPSRHTAAATRALVSCLDGVAQVVPDTAVLDLLTPGDTVSFSGSPETARRVRDRLDQVPLLTDTGSLGWAVLGPDVEAGTPAFDRFVARLVADLTGHAGQRPLAARRAMVPAALLDHVVDAVRDALAGVEVGPVARPDRLLRAVKSLRDAAEVVFGDPGRGPVLLRAADPELPEPHTVEAFGPVCTVMPWSSVEHAGSLVSRGDRAITGWAATSDPDLLRALVLAGGRFTQLGHGREAPALDPVLGFLRTGELRADPDAVGAVTGRWVPGGARRTSEVHPLRKYLPELRVGDTAVAGPRVVTAEDVRRFADLTGDHYYLHTDEEAAARNPVYRGIIAHGYLVVSLAAGLFITPEQGPVVANYGMERLRFLAPVRPGDALTVTLTAQRITPRPNAGYGEVRWDVDVANQDGTSVVRYELLTLIADRPAG
ncbi:aldehyde dehydrogenase family protein [Saccharothrix lopnurensis]|uniref:Aldehyde dehydrogenase family protein n=1 Tax=Saccharothrix lopnurensis TaxID=1670621 RepID=A0ABW1P471_9PSEU